MACNRTWCSNENVPGKQWTSTEKPKIYVQETIQQRKDGKMIRK
jgi:hypothetical protein